MIENNLIVLLEAPVSAKSRNGVKRSKDFEARVRQVMTTIEAEISAAGGIYPYNNGSLSLVEVARRANVHPTTFFSPKQRLFGEELRKWIKNFKTPITGPDAKHRNSLESRIGEWRKMYEGLAQAHRDTELELLSALTEIVDLKKKIREMAGENRT